MGVLSAVVITGINLRGVTQASTVQIFVILFLELVVVPFLFVGFDVIPQVCEEMHLPPLKLGGTIATSVLIATGWYAMVILTTSSAMSAEDLAGADIAAAEAFDALFHSVVMANVLLVDSGWPSSFAARPLVSVVFVLLRRREPQLERPYRIGGRGHGGTANGVFSVVLCLGLAALHLPGEDAEHRLVRAVESRKHER